MADNPVSVTAHESQRNVFVSAAEQLPTAAEEWAKNAWAKPIAFVEHTALEFGESATAGAAISYIMPMRGWGAVALGAAFTAPIVYHAIKGAFDANKAAHQPGADTDKIGHDLAYNAVNGTYDLGVSFAGGYTGARIGTAIADSNTAAGAFSRRIQTKILNGENFLSAQARTMGLFAAKSDVVIGQSDSAPAAGQTQDAAATRTEAKEIKRAQAADVKPDATFTIGSNVGDVIRAQGSPDEVLNKNSIAFNLDRWDGLADQMNKLQEGGFVFLYKPVESNIFLGDRAWVSFAPDSTVTDAKLTSGHLHMGMPDVALEPRPVPPPEVTQPATTFAVGSDVAEVVMAQGTPDVVLKGKDPQMPYLRAWDGLSDQLHNLPDGGFVFLYQPVKNNIFLGNRAWISFGSDSKVIDAQVTSGKLKMRIPGL